MVDEAGRIKETDFMRSDSGRKKVAPNESEHRMIEYPCFLVDVWKRRADLLVLSTDDMGNIRSYKVDHRALEVTDNDLLEAVKSSGGDLRINGSYPISQAIRDKIKACDICFIYADPVKFDSCEFDQKEMALPEYVALKLFQMPSVNFPHSLNRSIGS